MALIDAAGLVQFIKGRTLVTDPEPVPSPVASAPVILGGEPLLAFASVDMRPVSGGTSNSAEALGVTATRQADATCFIFSMTADTVGGAALPGFWIAPSR